MCHTQPPLSRRTDHALTVASAQLPEMRVLGADANRRINDMEARFGPVAPRMSLHSSRLRAARA